MNKVFIEVVKNKALSNKTISEVKKEEDNFLKKTEFREYQIVREIEKYQILNIYSNLVKIKLLKII